MTQVYLGLGSNLGDRAANLALARCLLEPGLTVLACSRIYESEPVGLLAQPLFLNQVASARTEMRPTALLDFLKGIEKEMGRQPAEKNGPRLIDLDLLFYGDWVLGGDGIVVPHPRLHERSFVLAPMVEIAPELVHPIIGKTISKIWSEEERRLSRAWPYFGG